MTATKGPTGAFKNKAKSLTMYKMELSNASIQ